jgi:hypothetical protein
MKDATWVTEDMLAASREKSQGNAPALGVLGPRHDVGFFGEVFPRTVTVGDSFRLPRTTTHSSPLLWSLLWLSDTEL